MLEWKRHRSHREPYDEGIWEAQNAYSSETSNNLPTSFPTPVERIFRMMKRNLVHHAIKFRWGPMLIAIAASIPGTAMADNIQDINDMLRPSAFSKLRAQQTCGISPQTPEVTDDLRYLELFDNDIYACFGGSFRLRYEWAQAPQLNALAEDDGAFFHRTMVHTGLHVRTWGRAFVELTAAAVTGRQNGPTPVDQDIMDVHQAFGEVTVPLQDTWSLRLRAGRQEVALGSGRLIDIREGPNVRRPFEGGRLTIDYEPLGNLSVMLLRPVRTQVGTFDNTSSDSPWLWGAYASFPTWLSEAATWDVYYLGLRDPNARYHQGTGRETRHSVGARFALQTHGFDTNIEAIVQFGEFGDQGRIFAWTLATNSGYRFENWPLKPRLGLSANVASGDRDSEDPDLQTFNALYPRGNYFGQLVLVGPANFFDVHPSLTLTLTEALLLSVDWEFFWRLSKDDGIYTASRSLLRPADASDARFVAHLISFTLDWKLHPHWALFFTYGQVVDGTFIADTQTAGTTRLFETSLVFNF